MRPLVAPLKNKLNGYRWPGIREYLIYTLLFAALFALLARIDHWLPNGNVLMHLAMLLLIVLLAGTLHVWLLSEKLLRDKPDWVKTFVTFGGNLLGIFFFVLASRQASWQHLSPAYQWAFLPALLIFSFPWVWLLTVLALANVPRLAYAPLTFKSLKDVLAEYHFAEDDTQGIRWAFEEDFQEVDASGFYYLRTHTPLEVGRLQLAMLFKGALSLNNHNLHPQRPIHFVYHNETAGQGFYGWQFYHRPYWFWPQRRVALDPNKTLQANRLRFRRITPEERAQADRKLPKNFKVAIIYIKRSK